MFQRDLIVAALFVQPAQRVLNQRHCAPALVRQITRLRPERLSTTSIASAKKPARAKSWARSSASANHRPIFVRLRCRAHQSSGSSFSVSRSSALASASRGPSLRSTMTFKFRARRLSVLKRSERFRCSSAVRPVLPRSNQFPPARDNPPPPRPGSRLLCKTRRKLRRRGPR